MGILREAKGDRVFNSKIRGTCNMLRNRKTLVTGLITGTELSLRQCMYQASVLL
jgi:hypothetical protein